MSVEFKSAADAAERLRIMAHYIGYAGAMATNMYLAGNSEKIELWEAERRAWAKRKDELLGALPVKSVISVEISEIIHDTYAANEVQVPAMALR